MGRVILWRKPRIGYVFGVVEQYYSWFGYNFDASMPQGLEANHRL
jgi:hypothetical protein